MEEWECEQRDLGLYRMQCEGGRLVGQRMPTTVTCHYSTFTLAHPCFTQFSL